MAVLLCLSECVSLSVVSDCSPQAPLSMGFPRQEYWRGLPCLPLGDLPNPGIKPASSTLQADSLPLSQEELLECKKKELHIFTDWVSLQLRLNRDRCPLLF